MVLPAPFGPISTVGAPGANRQRDAVEDRDVARAIADVLQHDRQIGRRARAWSSPGEPFAGPARGPGERVDDDDDDDQHDAEPDRERQVALGGLQRDRRGHGAGEAVDVAADDDDGADLGGGAAEAGEQRGHQAEARIPDQRRDAAQRADIHGGELVAILDPEILDGLARQRRDDRRHQDGLRDHHRLRREQQAPGPERAGARQQQIDRRARPPPAAGPSAR